MSRTQKLLKFLENGGVVTGKIALQKFGLYRLSEYVRRFRVAGHPVVTKMVSRRGVSFASYSLSSKPIKKI